MLLPSAFHNPGVIVKIPVIIIAATLALPITGCASIANQAAEKAVENALSSDGTNVDIQDGKVKIDSSEGSVEIGTDSELPADWPSDVPAPDGFTLAGVLSNKDSAGTSYTASWEAEGDKTADVKAYVESLKSGGWKIESDMTGLYTLTKGTQQIDIISGATDGTTSIVMAVGPKAG